MRDDPEDPECDDISLRIRRNEESGLIINGFALFVYVYKSDIAPQGAQRILKSSLHVRAFYFCLLLRCGRLPVSPGWCVYITCHVVHRVHWITRMLRQ